MSISIVAPPLPRPARQFGRAPPPSTDPPSPSPSPDTAAGMQALAKLLQPHLDVPRLSPDDIREAVAKEVASQVPRTHIVEVRRPDAPPVTLPGVQHAYFPLIVRLVSARIPTYIWGGAGCGKTHLAMSAAQALGMPVEAQSFTPDTSRAEVLGYVLPGTGARVPTPLSRAYVDGKLYLGDEVDACGPGIVALNMATANVRCSFAGEQLDRHEGFSCVLTGNTNGNGQADGYVRQRIDASTLDRLAVVHLPHDTALEAALAGLPYPEADAPRCDPEDGGVPTPAEWHAIVQAFRDSLRASQVKTPILGSNRAVLLGNRSAAAGIGRRWLAHMFLRKSNIQSDTWTKLIKRSPLLRELSSDPENI